MNAIAQTRLQRPSMESQFRQALASPKSREAIQAALGWDDSQVSRFLSGQLGLPINKIDAAIAALDMRVVTRQYLDAIGTLSITGAQCWCAREGYGNCGV